MFIIPHIRPAHMNDVDVIACLLAELGTRHNVTELKPRIHTGGDKAMFVALLDTLPVGVIEVQLSDMLHLNKKFARITTLVVGPWARRKGVGSALVEAAAAWAKDTYCAGLELTTPLNTAEAHDFYEALGFNISGLRYSQRWANA